MRALGLLGGSFTGAGMLPRLLCIICCLGTLRLVNPAPTEQYPLVARPSRAGHGEESTSAKAGRKLHGKFLQITGMKFKHCYTFWEPLANAWASKLDFHPDPFYKPYSSTEADKACHRGEGPAGIFGAETTDCDSPISLINATFEWIEKHVKDSIDFIVWTGDSARHDNDEELPRSSTQVIELNELMVNKFVESFGNVGDKDPTRDFIVPIIPTFGNNDILPHNIFPDGPNRWTKEYLNIWQKFIPEEQRHGFTRGGWFFVEAIPNKLAVFSINTMYFFDSNTAVDGCSDNTEPGYAQMEWLRIQLQFLRQRGMKAILTGHVAPARTESKMSWDETCWQKYTLWMQQYRDVIVGSLYGHMNIDHFMLQDFKELNVDVMEGEAEVADRMALDDDLSILSSAEYLSDLRAQWEKLPKTVGVDIASEHDEDSMVSKTKGRRGKKPKKSRQQKYFDKIGGPWGERFSLSLVSPSVVPNYYPTMRVFEYNITGLDSINTKASHAWRPDLVDMELATRANLDDRDYASKADTGTLYTGSKAKKKYKHKKPKFTIPQPPSKASPPGPAYSPQTFTWLRYTQYFANITIINDDFPETLSSSDSHDRIDPELADPSLDSSLNELRWHEGKHSGKKPHHKKGHRKFKYEVEYDTSTDSSFNMTDLTVGSYLHLASLMGQYKPFCPIPLDEVSENAAHDALSDSSQELLGSKGGELAQSRLKEDRKRKHKHRRRKQIERLWFDFVRRAYVGSLDEEELREEFGSG